MTPNRTDGSTRDVLVCADVLGAFGVTPADVRTQTDTTLEDRSLERTLTVALQDTRDRTAMLRQIICRSSHGIDCSARYSTDALADELAATFAAVDWSVDVHERGDRLEIRATDGSGRRRETELEYPETPLECDNLPVILAGLNDEILYGVDARFVLLSSGVDRWRAALIESEELAGVRERYGDRVPVFERPLLPEDGIDAYVSWAEGGESESESEGESEKEKENNSEASPWPAWALDRTQWSTSNTRSGANSSEPNDHRDRSVRTDSTPELIEEAEPDRSGLGSESKSESESGSGSGSRSPTGSKTGTGLETGASAPESSGNSNPAETLVTDAEESGETGNGTTDESDGLVLAGGAPTVSRVSGRERDPHRVRDRTVTATADCTTKTTAASPASSTATSTSRPSSNSNSNSSANPNSTADRNDRAAVVSRREKRETDTDGFGTLSGRTKTARVANDSFGADVETPTDDDRYRALGAAIGTGKNVSVKGLLDDDEFLPELPAADSVETRIEFEDEFDPAAVSKAKAAAEESGFEWVESGSLETTRVSNES